MSVSNSKSKRTGNLAEFFARSPLRRSGIKVKRRKDRPHRIRPPAKAR